MFKRITALALCLLLAASLLPAAEAFGRQPIAPESPDRCSHTLRVDPLSPDYVRPSYDGKLMEITPQRVEDHFNYLEDIYTDRYPEAALVVNTGDHRDQEVLKTLAETITAGCTTNTEKANAIDRWLFRNIVYDVNTSAYAYDTFYNRTGNCLSYANLMQFLLRSLGIPAVVGDGWRGDMKTSTVDLFNYEGHAWCFVYLEGEWVLYDPLWIECGTTDRDYIAEWIYLDTVEFVTPAYDGENLPPEAWNKPKVYYTDGRWYNFDDTHPDGYGNFTHYVNNQGYNFTPCQDELALGLDGGSDGWYILDGKNDKSGMQLGELYRNSWISYGEYENDGYISLTYAHVNGMQIDGAVMEYEGVQRYMQCNNSFPILAEEEDYTMQYGCMAFRPGYVGPFVDVSWGDAYDTDFHIVTWESDTPEVCTVDQKGILTAVAPGFAQIRLTLTDQEGGGYYSITYINVCVSDEVRVPDYSDAAPCEHSYVYSHTVPATCTEWGYEVHICSGCAEETLVYTLEPLGHTYADSVQTEPTCTEYGVTLYTCVRCSESYTAADIVPLGHDHQEAGRVEPTCTDYGYILYKCSRCPDSYQVQDGQPIPHSYTGAVFAEPTCTEWGVTRYSCSCGDSYDMTDIAPLGHDWQGVECTRCDATRKTPFEDVAEGAYYEEAVAWAVAKGITDGISDTEFGPKNPCDRSQVVTFLWRAAREPEPTVTENPFTDVAPGSYYEKAVLWAVENGITDGISDTEFGPGNPCDRSQVVTFLWRAAGEPEPKVTVNPFVDVVPGSYYEKAVLWAVEKGITEGISDTEFGPKNPCDRGQVVTFLWRAGD